MFWHILDEPRYDKVIIFFLCFIFPGDRVDEWRVVPEKGRTNLFLQPYLGLWGTFGPRGIYHCR